MPKEVAKLLNLPIEKVTDWVTVDFTPVEEEFFKILQEIIDNTSVLLNLVESNFGTAYVSHTLKEPAFSSFTRVLHTLCLAWFALGNHTNTFGFPEGFEESIYDLLDELDKTTNEENSETNE